MQSFPTPRPTSNPYIHMLDAALAETAGVEHLRFDRRTALFGSYDVLQLHWPETMLGGSTRAKALARRAFAAALAARLAISPVAVVRTVHNVELPSDVGRWERRWLEWIERRADHRIVLNEQTELPSDAASTLVLHGDYRDWFSRSPERTAEPWTLAFVGLVRRYKGVEHLLEAFAATAHAAPELRLRIAGRPTSADIEREVRGRAAADERVAVDLRHLSEDDFAVAIRSAIGVVLPYRFMHNSGSVLAALSLERPVLVPRTRVNEALAAEVGEGWVTMFDGSLDAEDLRAFAASSMAPPARPPDLARRAWHLAGPAHLSAFHRAVARRRPSR
ncbi:glycosyltransferase [Agrococcus sp. 1P02AA]|uniref:glycosyltransferase n=1 Tax=Agrococcus sp. 1P02AA TaxID=3132259 RepID=UPI0039A51359